MTFMVTGDAGLIGSEVIRFLINETNHIVLNLDKLTYSGNMEALPAFQAMLVTSSCGATLVTGHSFPSS